MNANCKIQLLLAGLLGAAVAAHAATTIGNGDWNTGGTWDSGVPGAGETAIVNHNVTIGAPSAALAAATISAGATLTFSNMSATLNATTVTVDGTVTHAVTTDTNGGDGWQADARVHITCTDLTVSATGAIDTDGLGFQGGSSSNGYGPGAGIRLSNCASGASHGGRGGNGHCGVAPGSLYGSASAPDQAGSGGASANAPLGGHGGGIIRIEATGVVTVDGVVSANGTKTVNSGWYAGGGSGGSVWIDCDTLQGSGDIQAMGGQGTWGGGGGGGRIAVAYNAASQAALGSQPTVVFAANAGSVVYPQGGLNKVGRPGTLYLTDATALSNTVLTGFEWAIPQATWTTSYLDVINVEPVEHVATLVLIDVDVTVTNDSLLVSTGLEISSSSATAWALNIGNNLRLESGATLTAIAAPASPGGVVNVGATFTIDNSTVYPTSDSENGGHVLFQATDLNLTAGSAFDADGRGYRGARTTNESGFGPGAGEGNARGGGGGHGGIGGRAGGSFGQAYDNPAAPVEPGSGGGGASGGGNPHVYGDGGGVVRLAVTGTAALNGTVTADGGSPNGNWYEGGGAGGSIYINACTLQGNASLTANGGNGNYFGHGAGGGLIALLTVVDASTVTTSVTAGTSGPAADAGVAPQAGIVTTGTGSCAAACVSCPDFQSGIIDALCNLPLASSAAAYKAQVEQLIADTIVSPICDDGAPGAGSESNCEAYLTELILNESACNAIKSFLP